ncbi:hypothetical protein LEMLEM_LOCUS18568, partial [Lemmus lemmus]
MALCILASLRTWLLPCVSLPAFAPRSERGCSSSLPISSLGLASPQCTSSFPSPSGALCELEVHCAVLTGCIHTSGEVHPDSYRPLRNP